MIAHAPFLYTSELESVATLCFRAFDGSNYEVRCAVSRLLGTLVAQTQLPPPPHLAKDAKGTHTHRDLAYRYVVHKISIHTDRPADTEADEWCRQAWSPLGR